MKHMLKISWKIINTIWNRADCVSKIKSTQYLRLSSISVNYGIRSRRFNLRKIFWAELLEKFNAISSQYKNVNPVHDHWLYSGSGVSGVPFNFVVTKSYVSVELLIGKSNQDENKNIW